MRVAAVAAAATAAALLPGEPLGVGVVARRVCWSRLRSAAVARPTIDAVRLRRAGARARRRAGVARRRLGRRDRPGRRLAARFDRCGRAARSPRALAPVARLHEAAGARRRRCRAASRPVSAARCSAACSSSRSARCSGRPTPRSRSSLGRVPAARRSKGCPAGSSRSSSSCSRRSGSRSPRDGRCARARGGRAAGWASGSGRSRSALLDALFLAFVARPAGRALRRARPRARDSRVDVRRVRAPGVLAAARRRRAHARRGRRGRAARRRASRRDARLVRVLLGVLCALAIVVVVSALHRLRLYEDAFGLTRHAARGRRVCALARRAVRSADRGRRSAASRAARCRARRRRDRGGADRVHAREPGRPDRAAATSSAGGDTGRLDVAYLQTLSADAAPALAVLPADASRRGARAARGAARRRRALELREPLTPSRSSSALRRRLGSLGEPGLLRPIRLRRPARARDAAVRARAARARSTTSATTKRGRRPWSTSTRRPAGATAAGRAR